jgi:CheY-like chemotaxis protein
LFAGQKLLVADDSPYYRTVIGLTFTDEGMEVATAGSGQEALEKLELSTPDVILAHTAMPGISGYELCARIKQSERFGHIPVMLLVGLHEPFDQAEARRVGADDIVAKPFKSIRQLVSRVGSLLGGPAADPEDTSDHEYSTLGLAHSDAPQPADPDDHNMVDPNVKVFIEAPSMTEHDPAGPGVAAAGSTCVADAELQTADTQKLERIDNEPAAETEKPISYAQADTIEMEPVTQTDQGLDSAPIKSAPDIKEAQTDNLQEDFAAHRESLREAMERSAESMHEALANQQSTVDVVPDERISTIGVPEMNEKPTPQTAPLQNQAVFNDALLDLGDFDSPAQVLVVEDLILDLDYEEPASSSNVTVAEIIPEPVFAGEAAAEAFTFEPDVAPATTHEEQHMAEFQEWAIIAETPAIVPEAQAEAPPPPTVSVLEEQISPDQGLSLSPETIDAIARRAVELMSDKVVREIAWEVVPELAELLIKQKLDEQSH